MFILNSVGLVLMSVMVFVRNIRCYVGIGVDFGVGAALVLLKISRRDRTFEVL